MNNVIAYWQSQDTFLLLCSIILLFLQKLPWINSKVRAEGYHGLGEKRSKEKVVVHETEYYLNEWYTLKKLYLWNLPVCAINIR